MPDETCHDTENTLETKSEDASSIAISPFDDSIPDGGLTAWLQVLGSFFMFFNTWGVVNAFGVYQTFYERDFLASEGASRISWIGSVQACILMVSGVITGPLFDLGYYRSLLVAGTILSVFAVMMTSICKEYWQVMLAQAVCMGIGNGCLFVPCVGILSTYFSRKRSLAVGMASSGSSLGAVIYSIVFHRLVDRIGFGNATRVIGYMMLGMLVITTICMKTRFTPTEKRDFLALDAFREPPFVYFCLAVFFGFLGLYIPFYYISAYAIDKVGVNSNLGFYLVPILNAGSIGGRLLPNYTADIFGPLNVMIPFTAACLVLAFAWLGINNAAGLIVFAVLYGFCSGTYVSMPPSTVASLTKDMHHVGSRIGTCFLGGGIGILVGSPIAGALVNLEEKSFWKAQVFCGVFVSAAVVCLVLARVAKTGPVLMTSA
ncbi:hypothetical protein MYAM1_003160 [Malassezia yamatoensis]|uniref:Major facilitator superfamily (MFS) profile domain-containing protein n=1 Tax=Malassezia yamatoensis TaxID=253288 RepID=A0AAJ5YUF1_9BASI|nr:hypothetical protein MYAM1_003160 [Malassezia yamatoensis]